MSTPDPNNGNTNANARRRSKANAPQQQKAPPKTGVDKTIKDEKVDGKESELDSSEEKNVNFPVDLVDENQPAGGERYEKNERKGSKSGIGGPATAADSQQGPQGNGQKKPSIPSSGSIFGLPPGSSASSSKNAGPGSSWSSSEHSFDIPSAAEPSANQRHQPNENFQSPRQRYPNISTDNLSDETAREARLEEVRVAVRHQNGREKRWEGAQEQGYFGRSPLASDSLTRMLLKYLVFASTIAAIVALLSMDPSPLSAAEAWLDKMRHVVREKYDEKVHSDRGEKSDPSPIYTLYRRPFQELNATKYQYYTFEKDLYVSNRYLEALYDSADPSTTIPGFLSCLLDPTRCELGHQIKQLRDEFARVGFQAPAAVDDALCHICHDMAKENDRMMSELREKPSENQRRDFIEWTTNRRRKDLRNVAKAIHSDRAQVQQFSPQIQTLANTVSPHQQINRVTAIRISPEARHALAHLVPAYTELSESPAWTAIPGYLTRARIATFNAEYKMKWEQASLTRMLNELDRLIEWTGCRKTLYGDARTGEMGCEVRISESETSPPEPKPEPEVIA